MISKVPSACAACGALPQSRTVSLAPSTVVRFPSAFAAFYGICIASGWSKLCHAFKTIRVMQLDIGKYAELQVTGQRAVDVSKRLQLASSE